MLNSIAVYFVLCIILAVQTVFIAVSCGKFRDEWWWRGWHLDGGSRGIQADQVWRPSSSRGSSLLNAYAVLLIVNLWYIAADRWNENLEDQGRLQQDPGLHRAVPLPQEPRSPRKRSCDGWYLPCSPVLIMFHCSAGGAGPFLTAAPLQQPSQEVEIWKLASQGSRGLLCMISISQTLARWVCLIFEIENKLR